MKEHQSAYNEEAWRLIVRYLDGSLTDVEQVDVSERLASDPHFAHLMEHARTLWSASRYRSGASPMLGEDIRRDWEKVAEAIQRDTRSSQRNPRGLSRYVHRRHIQVIRLAAILLVTILSSVFITYMALKPDPAPVQEMVFREIQTDRNQRVNLMLSDGTGVSLSVESRLIIPDKFAPDVRQVELTGEARFDVAHAPNRPFLIRSGDVTVQVLGTDFGVRAYENENRVDVVVKSGSVAVERNGVSDPERVVLSPGQLVSVRAGNQPMVTRDVNADDYLGWMNGRMKFHETPFSEVISQLERWYDIQIVTRDQEINEFVLTALLDVRSMEHVFEVISQSLKLNYWIEEDRVELTVRPVR